MTYDLPVQGAECGCLHDRLAAVDDRQTVGYDRLAAGHVQAAAAVRRDGVALAKLWEISLRSHVGSETCCALNQTT